MPTTLDSNPVSTVLEDLFAAELAQTNELEARADEIEGFITFDRALCAELKDALLAVDRRVGRFLYSLVRAKHAVNVVEFGTSFGVSAIHIASALRDNGGGTLVTTEIQAEKGLAARANLVAAGLSDLVEVRVGDAQLTLRDAPEPIDMVLLDGWPNLYLPVLLLLEPRLRDGCVVLADDLPVGGPVPPEPLREFYKYVRDPRHGYATVDLPLGDGVEFCVRLG